MGSSPPDISVSLALSPIPHSYSSSNPPELSLTIVSHAPRPLTILSWGTLFDLPLALLQPAFRLTDLESEQEVGPQHSVRLQRGPLHRRVGDSDVENFITLHPEQPVAVSTPFGYRVESWGPPRPAGAPGRQRNAAQGRKIERSVCGVDGLIPGREYELRAVDGLKITWWRWGTRGEVLEPSGSTEWELGHSEEGFDLNEGAIEPIVFEVVD